jgi:prepilin-type N-terminal cleavage/methylation domain-containing protein
MPQRGFSLLELIVVLGLTAILVVAAVFGHAAVRARVALALAAQQVAMDLSLARIRAIARNRDQRLVFMVGTGAYRAQERTSGVYSDVGPASALPSGARISDCTGTDDAIGFRARGGASPFGSVTLRAAGGETAAVVVGITGRARIQ